MGFTQIGAMPKNQLDALPLYSASSAASGGSVSLAPGGGLVRSWSPTILGINGVNFAADGNGQIVLVSNFIDTTGCTRFNLILTRTNAAAGVLLSAIIPQIQYRLSPTDPPPTSFGGGGNQLRRFCGTIQLENAGGIVFPAMVAANDVQRSALGFSASVIANAANANGTTAMIGTDVRLFFNIDNPNPAPAAGNTFTCTLIGS